MKNTTRGYILGSVSAASYGINPLAVFLYNANIGVDSVLFYRYAFAIVILGAMMLLRRESFAITVKEFFLLLVLGLLFSLSSLALFVSYKYIDIGIASTLLFVYPALVAVIMTVLFKERPSVITIVALLLVGLGIVLLNGDSDGSSASLFGIMIVIASSLSYAIYIVAVQKSSIAKMSPIKLSFYSLTFGLILYVVRLDFCTQLQALPTLNLQLCVLALVIFPTLISLTALAQAIKYIGSTSTAILGALEPVTAVMLGIIIFGERPSMMALFGMVVVVAAVTLIVASPKITQLLICLKHKLF